VSEQLTRGEEQVTCPECGHSTVVQLNARRSTDFCPQCDYPLFWASSRVVALSDAATQDESLRRLPGTAGRVSVANIPCPHCSEQNPVVADTCVRCHGELHPAAPAPEPEPVTEVVEVVEEKKKVPIWPWILVVVITVLLLAGAAWATWGYTG
jgi:hypothetical protein